MTQKQKIILLTDILETKVRKEKELEFYREELRKLQDKIYWLNREVDLTNTIIAAIESEDIYDVKENLLTKDWDGD